MSSIDLKNKRNKRPRQQSEEMKWIEEEPTKSWTGLNSWFFIEILPSEYKQRS